MQTRNDAETRDKIWEMIKDIRIAQLITQDDLGRLHARPMAAIKREGDILWFMTRDDSGKIAEIRKHPQVLLSYSEPKDQQYVSVRGPATIFDSREKIEELWSEAARVWFPKGPSDPAITLIRIEAESAEYWDAPSSAFVYAYGYVKARLTGEAPHNIAETGHVDLKNVS